MSRFDENIPNTLSAPSSPIGRHLEDRFLESRKKAEDTHAPYMKDEDPRRANQVMQVVLDPREEQYTQKGELVKKTRRTSLMGGCYR